MKTVIINIGGIDCYEENGTVYLKLETVARGLGFTQTQNKNGTEYVSIRWERIGQYLTEFGFTQKWGKDGFIPENIFYRLAMKAKNEVAEAFLEKVTYEVLPKLKNATKNTEIVQISSNITSFNSPEFGEIRTIAIDNEPWFVGKDVAEILAYKNPSEAIQDHVDEDDKLNSKMLSSFEIDLGQRGGWLINESGLYSLILSSQLPSAKKFKRWITHEVIPSIRKTGSYSVKQPVQKEEPSLREQAMFNNSCARMDKMSIEKAKTWMQLGEKFGSIPEFKQICASYAGEALAGKPVLSLPEVQERTYTATEVGKILGGISANKVGKLANKHNLKVSEYGKYVWDKSRHSDKQVETWRYNDKGIEALRNVLNQEENYN